MVRSGKSKVGRVLSSFLDYPFLDTDELIEELTKEKISTIFQQDGEEAFREMETQILQVWPGRCRPVVTPLCCRTGFCCACPEH